MLRTVIARNYFKILNYNVKDVRVYIDTYKYIIILHNVPHLSCLPSSNCYHLVVLPT
jgi:hypothetical protein